MLGPIMEENDKMERVQIAKEIEEKLEIVSELRSTLEQRKLTLGCSIDDQILLAETECRLAQEEMTLLSLQEQHWKSAALWNESQEPEFQSPICEVLHSHIVSLKEKGAIPTLHATEYSAVDNGVLISFQGNRPSVPVVEWAHETTELQIGDRLLEVNGHSVIGKDSNEVTQLLSSSSSSCRVVFLRPLPVNQLLKNFNCKEVSNLRQELTSVVSRLNYKIAQNKGMMSEISKLRKSLDGLETTYQKLKLQVVALQKVLWFFFGLTEKTNMTDDTMELLKNTLLSNSLRFWTFSCVWSSELRNSPVSNFPDITEILPTDMKSIAWCEMVPPHIQSRSNILSEERTDTESGDFSATQALMDFGTSKSSQL